MITWGITTEDKRIQNTNFKKKPKDILITFTRLYSNMIISPILIPFIYTSHKLVVINNALRAINLHSAPI